MTRNSITLYILLRDRTFLKRGRPVEYSPTVLCSDGCIRHDHKMSVSDSLRRNRKDEVETTTGRKPSEASRRLTLYCCTACLCYGPKQICLRAYQFPVPGSVWQRTQPLRITLPRWHFGTADKPAETMRDEARSSAAINPPIHSFLRPQFENFGSV